MIRFKGTRRVHSRGEEEMNAVLNLVMLIIMVVDTNKNVTYVT